ncbi:MAG: bifunctional homocysteine S-methyltransferase/methylenetetrahydrofolate reductase [Planctomycetes bacterium]|nr:bifunctional homocysteine S-methyltransferase/methylenetetrahydrofolate reductase [Planctomycetota bacterium]
MGSSHSFLDLLAKQVVLADGAMGSMLYNQGVFVNRCFDALNLEDPALVQNIHEAYVAEDVDLIETNTFGANAFRLAKYGLAQDVDRINRSAVRIAREAAQGRVLVAGAIGPVGAALTGRGTLSDAQVIQMFQDQAGALVAEGVDLLILETFSQSDEMLLAISALADITDVPLIAQMTADKGVETVYGERIDDAIRRIAAHPSVAVVGLNCSTGPCGMLASLECIRPVTDKPISVQPNAGMPRRVEERTLYMSTPEYMAEYAKRFFEKGARVIGGCCGTTPDHLREIVRSVRGLDRAMGAMPGRVEVRVETLKPQEQLIAAPLETKSRLGQKLAQGEKVAMIEVTPPRGVDVSSILDKAHVCVAQGVDAINIPDGPRASSRLSPLVTAVQIQQHVDMETVLHFCCRDRNLIGMQSDLLGASAMGLNNMLIITGDPPKLGDYPDATGVFDMDSVALTAVLRRLNCGVDIGGNKFDPSVNMTIGVGANPVAADLEREIARFQSKVEAGAEYAITQPVFDVDSLFRFLDDIQDFAIPVVAGIWPFTSFKNAEFMANEVPGVSVPEMLLDRMSRAKTREDGRALGIAIAHEMVEAIQDRVAGFAVSAPFGNVHTALAVLGRDTEA